jgi:hypothetical protein
MRSGECNDFIMSSACPPRVLFLCFFLATLPRPLCGAHSLVGLSLSFLPQACCLLSLVASLIKQFLSISGPPNSLPMPRSTHWSTTPLATLIRLVARQMLACDKVGSSSLSPLSLSSSLHRMFLLILLSYHDVGSSVNQSVGNLVLARHGRRRHLYQTCTPVIRAVRIWMTSNLWWKGAEIPASPPSPPLQLSQATSLPSGELSSSESRSRFPR